MDFLESIKNKWKNKLTLDMGRSQGIAEQKKTSYRNVTLFLNIYHNSRPWSSQSLHSGECVCVLIASLSLLWLLCWWRLDLLYIYTFGGPRAQDPELNPCLSSMYIQSPMTLSSLKGFGLLLLVGGRKEGGVVFGFLFCSAEGWTQGLTLPRTYLAMPKVKWHCPTLSGWNVVQTISQYGSHSPTSMAMRTWWDYLFCLTLFYSS